MSNKYISKTITRYKEYCQNNNREYVEPHNEFNELLYLDKDGNCHPFKNESTVDIMVSIYDRNHNQLYSLTFKD